VTEDWPRLPDPDDDLRLRLDRTEVRIGKVERHNRQLRWIVVLTAVCMFLASALFTWYVLRQGDVRRSQLCATWYAGITQAPPDEQIPTVLLDLYGAAQCTPPLTPEQSRGG
jgi:hypothetical protein